MIVTIWNDLLYQPLFNGLIYIYNNWTDQNLGWAIVYLTVLLRTLLVPLTIVHLVRSKKNILLSEDVKKIEAQYKNDFVLKKQEIRKILKQRQVSPWAKALSLGIQGLVLLLLYQVFLHGITGKQMLDFLYSFVAFPGTINVMFYNTNLGQVHTIFWPSVVALLLFVENYIEAKSTHVTFTKKDLNYLVLFPLAIFAVLWWLPSVKAIFVLTSMMFSIILNPVLSYLFGPKSKKTT